MNSSGITFVAFIFLCLGLGLIPEVNCLNLVSLRTSKIKKQISGFIHNKNEQNMCRNNSKQEEKNNKLKRRTDEPKLLPKLARRTKVYWIAYRIYADYQKTKRQEKRKRKEFGISEDQDGDDYPDIITLWDSAHEKNALRLTENIKHLSGFWVKVGQFLSSRTDIMPQNYLKSLSSLQDSLPPKPFEDILKTLDEEFTKDEMSLIKYIDPEPLATASIAQVHRATMLNGQEVVIKVQHRGVSSLMLQDMENLSSILGL